MRANRLLEVCKEKGYTLAGLAIETGIPKKTIYQYSQDARFPRIQFRLLIASVLGVDEREIFDERAFWEKRAFTREEEDENEH